MDYKALLTQHNSFYLYDLEIVQENIQALQSTFPQVGILYSMKTNPHEAILRQVFSNGLGADAASLGEVELAVAQGLKPDQIQYSAPGKSMADIATALPLATLIADSAGEVERIAKIALMQGIVANIGLRINPDFTMDGLGGAPSKFGIDQETVLENIAYWNALPQLNIVGIHVHLRSQELCGLTLCSYYEKMFDLVKTIETATQKPLDFVNLGSGIGVAYGENDAPMDLALLKETMDRLLEKKSPHLRVYIESGRFIAANCGTYVSKVLDIKESYGTKYVILANTLNGFIRPAMAQMMAGLQTAGEPFFTHEQAFPMTTTTQGDAEIVTVVGNLCTGTDLVGDEVSLPHLEVGDGVIFHNAGAYAAVITPMQFSSQTPPAILIRGLDGVIG